MKPRSSQPPADWQVLDAGSIWMKEFALGLGKLAPTISWAPSIENFGHWLNWEREEWIAEPGLTITWFPLQRGYARSPIDSLLPFQRKLINRLCAHTHPSPRYSNLICSTPFYAPVAELWPGSVVYYVTDLTKSYEGCDEKQVVALDIRLCKVAQLVCPNSRRIADYLIAEAGCTPEKIVIVPNATRRSNIPEHALTQPQTLPASIGHLNRPIAGVIGNLSWNMDWLLLKDAISRTPGITWVFVGPTSMRIQDQAQTAAREWAMKNAHFTGPKPYGQLQSYARAFDVAVLPYHKHEPTYSGSSTRFYEHLPACRPMVGTRGFAELLEKEPLIKLIDTGEELASALQQLGRTRFSDGYETDRWLASQTGTWDNRARTIVQGLSKRAELCAATAT